MPLDLLKRRGDKSQPNAEMAPALLPEDIEAEEHELKLTYRAKTSQGVRMAAGPKAMEELPNMLLGLARSSIEVVGPLDLAETVAVALLSGELDTSGYPEYDAIVGGVASHWDEASEHMVARGVAGWGGRGVRGDTDRTAQRILAGLLANVPAPQHAVGFTPVERPVARAGAGGSVCAHCSFASAHERAFYCPRCGMRMVRG